MESLAESMPGQATMPRFEDGSINLRELIGALAEDVVDAIMDAEADRLCAGGANSRNGYRERNPAACVGDIALRIPKLRSGSFFPEDVVERYRRVGRAVVAAIGCDKGGWRHVLGPSAVDTESCDSWLGFLRASNVQERADREIKRRSRVVQVLPPEKSPELLVGAVMSEQDEIWSESRYFAQEKIQELCDEKRAMAPAASETPAAELAAEARKMILASLELAERVEAA